MRRSRRAIEEELRCRIRAGVYAPGSRMASRRELQSDLGVSSVTLQRAFERLVDQGYVHARGAQGTYVAKVLPNRSRIALVLPEDTGRGGWNRFMTTAKRVAEEWNEGDARFRIYHIASQRSDSAGHRRLCADVAEGGLAGVVFITSPFFLVESPVLAADIPRVCIGGGDERDVVRFRHSIIRLNESDLPGRIVRRFQAAGRHRLAALTSLTASAKLNSVYLPLLHDLGLTTRPEWWLGLPMDPTSAMCARSVARLLFSGGERQRPDCLLIADDNLVAHATAGLLDAGIQVPDTVLVAAHANFPGPTLAAVPCLRFGTDMAAQVRTAIAELQVLTAGGKPRIVDAPLEFRDI